MPAFGALIAQKPLRRTRRPVLAGVRAIDRGGRPRAALAAGGGRGRPARLGGFAWSGRFLPVWATAVAALGVLVQHVINALAAYLRAHRQEPLLLCSVIGAVLVGFSTYLLGRYVGTGEMVAGLLVINIVYGLPWVGAIFVTKRRDWHAESPAVRSYELIEV